MFPAGRLADDAIRLRPFRPDDAPAVARACADPVTARFVPELPVPYTEADAAAYIELAARAEADPARAMLAVADSSTDELLGSIDVRLRESRRADVGYWVAPWARGRGVATRALRLVARWALDELAVERLELTTDPENEASQRVAEKAGFTREAVLRGHLATRDGGRRDSVMFSLLPGELEG